MSSQLRNHFEQEHTRQCKVCQQYFSIATVAKRFEISEKTVRRMIAESRIKAKRIRGSIRISHEELEKLIREY